MSNRPNPAELSPTLMSKLGLEQQPFAPPEHAEALYRNTALDMLHTSITQQLTNTTQIQIIKGEAGLGKSCFCLRLREQVPKNTAIIFVTATAKTGILEILKNIIPANAAAPALELPALAKAGALSLYRHLCDDVQPVLLIDDAHRLTPKTLINLLRFQSAVARQNLGTFKLILIGERKIDTRLEAVDADVVARENLFASLLRPLNRNEIRDYLAFRFKQVPPLTEKQLNYIRSHSGGIPGKIEALAARMLAGETPGGGNRPLLAIAAGITLLAAGAAAYQLGYLPVDTKKTYVKKPAPVIQTGPQPTAISEPLPEDSFTMVTDTSATDDISSDAVITASEPTEAEPATGLSGLPPEHFLIQLMASTDATRVEQYRQDLQLEGLLLHETLRNGQPWYALFYGPFANQATAKAALAKLPAKVQANKPWIRRIDSIPEAQ
jgi:type II secretory pathway predicted ATPase ExeA